MSYLDDEEGGARESWSRKIGGVVGGFLLFALVTFGAKAVGFFAGAGVQSVIAGQQSITPERVERELAEHPEMAETRAVLRDYYPDAWRGVLQDLSQGANSGDLSQAEVALFHRMRRMMVSKRHSIIAAPDADLIAIAQIYLTLSEALRESDVSLCATFFMRGLSPGYRVDPQVRALIDRASAAQLRAAYHAENGQRSPRRAATDADLGRWFEQIERASPQSATLFAEERLETATPQQQCDASVAMWGAAAALPPSQSAIVTATLMDEALGSP